jgi:phage baseplate assembly protein W
MNEDVSGLSFPFRVAGGRVATSHGPDKVEQQMRHLLLTRLGERPMLRAYGGGAYEGVQEPDDDALRALVKHELELAIRTFMPEVRLTAPVRIVSQDDQLIITILYMADPRGVVRRVDVVLP